MQSLVAALHLAECGRDSLLLSPSRLGLWDSLGAGPEEGPAGGREVGGAPPDGEPVTGRAQARRELLAGSATGCAPGLKQTQIHNSDYIQ